MSKIKLTKKQQAHLGVIGLSLQFVENELKKITKELNENEDVSEDTMHRLNSLHVRYDLEFKNLLNWLNKEKLPFTKEIKSLLPLSYS